MYLIAVVDSINLVIFGICFYTTAWKQWYFVETVWLDLFKQAEILNNLHHYLNFI